MRETRSDVATCTAMVARGQDEGQTLVEYVLVVGFVSVALVATLGLLAGGLGDLYNALLTLF